MFNKILPAALMLLAVAQLGHAADMAIDCKLKGGSVVQLPAEACELEGGLPAHEVVAPASDAVFRPVNGNISANLPLPSDDANHSKLTDTQKWIVDLLAKPVSTATPLNKNPEGMERSAKFDGCRLVVDEYLHIQYGNAFSVWKDFKVNSVIDLQSINRNEFGILGKVTSKGGSFSGVAVYFEESKSKGGNHISISVLNLRDGVYTKYTSHGPGAYWDTPHDDLWMADEYGYAKDTGWGTVATDKIRILLIANSPDDAEKLKIALVEVNALCKSQQVETH